MAITFVSGVSTDAHFSNVASVGAPINTTGATLLVAVVASQNSIPSNAVSFDSYGNTWTALTNYGGAGGHARIFYCANPIVGSSHYWEVTPGSNSFPSASFMAFAGVKYPSPFDTEVGSSASGTSTKQAGSITPAESDELVVFGALHFYPNTSTPPTIDSSFSTPQYAVATSNYSAVMSYKIKTTNASENPTFTTNNAYTYNGGAAQAAFKQGPVSLPGGGKALLAFF